jgi:cytochrome P450
MQRSPLKVPGPRPLPLVSGWFHLARFGLDPFSYIDGLFERFGPIASLVFGRATRVVSTEPYSAGTIFVHGADLNRQVVSRHEEFHKTGLVGPLYPHGEVDARRRPLQRMLTGLFHVNGEEHKAQRRLLMPAFHKKRIESYRDDMVAITLDVLQNFREGERRDVRRDTVLITSRIATKTLFGADAGTEGAQIGDDLQEWLRLFSAAMVAPFDLPFVPYARWLDLAASVDERMRAIIEAKRKSAERGDDMLSSLLEVRDEAGRGLTEDELIGHTSSIFGAGHETSSNALCWTLFLLSQHPTVAAELHEELKGELCGEAPRVEQLSRLPLLDRVIKESLRLFPPAPFNHRISAGDFELGGCTVPRGTEIMVSLYHTQRDPSVYTDPHRFKPERWEKLDPGPYAYSPFSAGPRMCIGAAFAMMEIKIVLAILLQRYRFELASRRVDRFISITLTPKGGLYMKLSAPGGAFERSSPGFRGNVREMLQVS